MPSQSILTGMNLTVPHEEDGLKKQQYHCVVKILYPISLRLSIHSSKFAAKMQRFGANVQKSVVKNGVYSDKTGWIAQNGREDD